MNYLAQRSCLGSNIFAYHKDLLFVFDIEIICLIYIKINDDWLYGLHNFVITYNIVGFLGVPTAGWRSAPAYSR